MQNNIKVIISECHLSILEKPIAHSLNKKIHLCNPKNYDLHVKDVNISGIFNSESITIKQPTKEINKNKDTLLNSKSCIYKNTNVVF